MRTPEQLREELRRARNDKEARIKGVVIKDYDLYRRQELVEILAFALALTAYFFIGFVLGGLL